MSIEISEVVAAEVEVEPVFTTPATVGMIYNPVVEEGKQVFPLACEGCKLLDRFKEGLNNCHAITPRYDLRKLEEAKGTILVIVPSPGEREDKAGHPLTMLSGGGFLNSYLSNLDNHWVVANSQGCYGGKDPKGAKVKMVKQQVEKCRDAYVRELICHLRPKVVVFLGLEPMQCVLGPHAPKTLGKALGDPIKFPENDYFIIGAEDPSNHMTQRKDLEKTYMALFQQADRLCNGDYHEEVVEYELVTTTSRLKELSRSLQERICLDTEDDRNLGRNLGSSNLVKKSIWHPGVNLILLQITERVDTFYEPMKLKNYVFVPEILTRENIILLIKDRILMAHSVKNDIQVLWATKQVDCFRHIKSYVCTFLQFVSMDQGQMGNGLKERSRLHFNINSYETEAWRDIDGCNKAIADSHALVIQMIKDEEKKFKEIDVVTEKKEKADYKYNLALGKWQAHVDENLKREGEGRKTLKAKAEPERKEYVVPSVEEIESNIARYKEAQSRLRPLKDATFGDITPSVLWEYAAKDTFYGYKIQDEVLDQYQAAGAIHPLSNELNLRAIKTTAMIERWGLAMDMSRHRILSEVIDKKVAILKEQLVQNKYVIEALSRTQEVADLSSQGKLTYEYLIEEAIKPNKKKFLAQLLLVTGVINEHSPETKSSGVDGRAKEYKIDSSVLEDISGGVDDTDDLFKKKGWTPSEKKSEVQWVWYFIWHYRKLLDLQRKFLKSLGSYAVKDRLHPNFLIGRVETGKTSQGTITGRLATSDPNLLNIKKDKALRWIFPARLNSEIDSLENTDYIKEKKAWILEIDYSSQEIAIASVVTGCKAWQYMFSKGFDIYSCVANDLYSGGIDIYGDPATVRAQLKAKFPKDGPGSAVRDDVKTSCLAWLFLQQPWAFSNRTGIPLKKVEEFYGKMAKAYPEVKAYHKRIEQSVNSGEMIENLFGLRRSTRLNRTGDPKRDYKNRLRLVSQLTNFLVQSCAAGQSLTLAYHVCMWIVDNRLEDCIQMNNLVHDSIVFTVADEFLEEAEKNINSILYNMKLLPFDMGDIVLGHSFKIGDTLSSLKQITSIAEWRKEQAVAALPS